MLPEALSNGICSLNPNEDRLTKTVCIEFNARGEAFRSRFFNSVIRSHERMTYTAVRKILLDRDPDSLERYRDFVDQFKLMEELALLINEIRSARGNLDFDLPEAEILLDIQGVPENIVRAERNIAHRIIEEFMIAANEAVGILIDQNTSLEEGVFVDFFGVTACANVGLARLAAHTGATVIPGFAIWSDDERRYILRFDAPVEMTGDAEADTRRLQKQLECVIRQYPDQWLWIHRRWKTPPGPPSPEALPRARRRRPDQEDVNPISFA